ncbi:hypothetical protein Gotur_024294 [Gossypium turneri]
MDWSSSRRFLGILKLQVDFFKKLRQRINPVPTILAEIFRSLNVCRRKGEGRFIGCAQLLTVWILSHFWKVERTPFHMFSKTFAPLETHIGKDWPKDVTEQHWGGVGYAPLLVQRQFASRQFVPVTDGLAQSEFAFMGEGYMKKVRDTTNSWRQIYLMELALYADTITVDYDIWRQQRVKSQITPPIDEACRNPFSEEIPSELEIARHEFER